MGISQRKIIIVSVALTAVAAVVGWIVWQMRPSVVLAKRHAALIDGIERRSPARISRLVAKGYSDRWGFSCEDLVATMIDGGSQFLVLTVETEDLATAIDGRRAEISFRMLLGGTPVGPAGGGVLRQINQLGSPFVFTWEKQSFLPSSWRLVRVENAALPDDLYGYEPGDLKRAIRGE